MCSCMARSTLPVNALRLLRDLRLLDEHLADIDRQRLEHRFIVQRHCRRQRRERTGGIVVLVGDRLLLLRLERRLGVARIHARKIGAQLARLQRLQLGDDCLVHVSELFDHLAGLDRRARRRREQMCATDAATRSRSTCVTQCTSDASSQTGVVAVCTSGTEMTCVIVCCAPTGV
jgi:hypothetical protein